jgi:hypothetical protein
MNSSPARVRSLLMMRVPMETPGARVPPGWMVTARARVPVLRRVAVWPTLTDEAK